MMQNEIENNRAIPLNNLVVSQMSCEIRDQIHPFNDIIVLITSGKGLLALLRLLWVIRFFK